MHFILLFIYTLAIAAYAWADQNGIIKTDKRIVYVAKLLLTFLVGWGTSIVYIAGLFLWATGIDREVRGLITKTTAIDKDSWWGKAIFNKYGKVWAERLVWIELILFAIIELW